VASSQNLFRRRLLGVGLVLMVMAGLGVFLLRQREPVHDGRTVSQWLEIAESPLSFVEGRAAAEEALDAANEAIGRIGSKAVPVLLRKLKSDDRYRRPAANLWNSFANRVLPSSWYSTLYVKVESAFDHQQQALHGFRIIGTNADSAVPGLKDFLSEPKLATNASRCLAYIHTSDALNALASGLANPNPNTRFHCLNFMASYDDEALRPFSESIKLLTGDTDESVAGLALALIGGLLTEQDVVRLSLPKLKDSRPNVQRRALHNLFFGPETSMQAISECFSSLDLKNRVLATNALLSINPYRAPEFGVFTNGIREDIFEWYDRRALESQRNSSRQQSPRLTTGVRD